jgi:hypothetical protein
MKDKDTLFLENAYKLVLETPIDTFERIGEWEPTNKPRGWDKASRGILTSPSGVEKIKNLWNKLPEDVDMYLVSNKEGWKHTEVGQVPYEFVRNELKLNIPIDSDHITIIYTNNKGSEKVPATAWTLAHRFGHALRRQSGFGLSINPMYKIVDNSINELIEHLALNLYRRDVKNNTSTYGTYNNEKELIKKAVCNALGTFRSAREKILRNSAEFANELVAQYIITGKIKFNTEYPQILATRYTWGHPQGAYKKPLSEEEIQDLIHFVTNKENDIRYAIEDMISNAVGNIFVM